MADPGRPRPADGRDAAGRPAPALVLSCVFGALGALCIVVGAVVGNEGAFVAGAGAGALSLAAALYWRSELISSAAERRRRGAP